MIWSFAIETVTTGLFAMAAVKQTQETSTGIRIGKFELSSPYVMAPMAGITDPPFRRLVRHFGAGLSASEMTTADTRLWQSKKSRHRLDFDNEASPRVVQIAGSDPFELADAARALEGMGADIVDINMGCPAKKVCRKLAGSALMQDESLVARILNAVVTAVEIPVTLKMRTGWNTENRNANRLARLAEEAGIAALAIHGRTRECRYRGEAEYATIAEVAENISIPLFANGDINTVKKALEVKRLSGADGIMIGRGAQGRPWLFRDLNAHLSQEKNPSPLPIAEVRDIILGHLDDMYRFYGEESGVRVARKHLTWYAQQFVDSAAFRYQVVRVNSTSEQLRLTRSFMDTAAWCES